MLNAAGCRSKDRSPGGSSSWDNRLTLYNEQRYAKRVIRSFADVETERLWRTGKSRKIPTELQERARRKLAMLDAATRLEDLTSPPANRLELLRGDRKGQHSIRINRQFRICFVWLNGDTCEVEVTDYH